MKGKIISWKIILILVFSVLAISQISKTNAVSSFIEAAPLAAYLNEDWTLSLPQEEIVGALDPTGFQLVSAPGEAPRFAPITGNILEYGGGDANWDPQFSEPGVLYGSVYALLWDGANLYIGGSFTYAGGAPANHIVRWMVKHGKR